MLSMVHFQHCAIFGWAGGGVRERRTVALDVRGPAILADRKERTSRRLTAGAKDMAGSALEDVRFYCRFRGCGYRNPTSI